MFAHNFFPARMFATGYFPPAEASETPAVESTLPPFGGNMYKAPGAPTSSNDDNDVATALSLLL